MIGRKIRFDRYGLPSVSQEIGMLGSSKSTSSIDSMEPVRSSPAVATTATGTSIIFWTTNRRSCSSVCWSIRTYSLNSAIFASDAFAFSSLERTTGGASFRDSAGTLSDGDLSGNLVWSIFQISESVAIVWTSIRDNWFLLNNSLPITVRNRFMGSELSSGSECNMPTNVW